MLTQWVFRDILFFLEKFSMYSKKSLYYLNQLGIRPWIQRSDSLSMFQGEAPQKEIFQLVVVLSSTLSVKAQSLCNQLIVYFNFSRRVLEVLVFKDCEFSDQFPIKIEPKNPKAILVLGGGVHHLDCDCPVVHSMDPEYLVANPEEKRNAFKQLHHWMQLFYKH